MIIGTLTIDFMLHGCRSLKEKRAVVKSLIAKIKNKFNVSVAETDFLDIHARGSLGIAVISNERRHANSMLDKIADFVDKLYLVDVTNIYMEFI